MIDVSRQLPEFIQTDYPGFVEFLKAYYKWQEEVYGIGYFGDLVDIDKTIDGFLKYFRKELDIFGITNDETSRFYLRHLKELYTSKGSREAVQFLFKILYDKNSTVRLPWDYTAIASGGKWRVPFSIIVAKVDVEGAGGLTLEQAQALVGNEIILIDGDGYPWPVMVEYISQLPSGNFEVFVGRYGYTRTPPAPVSFTFEGGDYSYSIESRVNQVSIIDGGTGFEAGQIYHVTVGAATGMQIRIAAVDADGTILAVEIISFGDGYPNGFTYSITGAAGVAEVSFYPRIHLLVATDTLYLRAAADGSLILGDYTIVTADAGNLPHGLETGDAVVYRKGDSGNTAVPPLVSEDIYYVIRVDQYKLKLATTYNNALAGTAINLLTGATGSGHTLSRLGDATLRFSKGTLRSHPGYYIGSGSVLGDGCFIEDSFYYQVYSYVTILEETLAKYRAILKDVLHPAGTRNFGEQTITLTPEMPSIAIDLEIDAG